MRPTRMRLALLRRSTMNFPARVRPQQWVNPRKSKVCTLRL